MPEDENVQDSQVAGAVGEDGSPSTDGGAVEPSTSATPAPDVSALQAQIAELQEARQRDAEFKAQMEDATWRAKIAAIPDPAQRAQAESLYQQHLVQKKAQAEEERLSAREAQLQEGARLLKVREFADKYGADATQLEKLSRTYTKTADLEELAKSLSASAKGAQRREPAAIRGRVDSASGQGAPARTREQIVAAARQQVIEGVDEAKALFDMHRNLAAAGFEVYPMQAAG